MGAAIGPTVGWGLATGGEAMAVGAGADVEPGLNDVAALLGTGLVPALVGMILDALAGRM